MNKKYSQLQLKFINYFNEQKEYELISEYKNTLTPITVKHSCGHEYMVKPKTFRMGKGRCPECAKPYNTEKVKDIIFKATNGNIIVLDDYEKNNIPMKCLSKDCGHIFYMSFSDLKRIGKCRECHGRKFRTTEDFKQDVYDLYKNEYTVVGDYVKNDVKIKMRHNTCGHEYEMRPDNILYSRQQCPRCNKRSHNEILIEEFLKESNYNFESEKRFDDCRYKYTLPFDFCIEIKDKTILVEYNGRQHYMPLTVFGGENHYKLVQKRDKIKIDYCKEKGYDLIIIKYTVKNVIDYLKKELDRINI